MHFPTKFGERLDWLLAGLMLLGLGLFFVGTSLNMLVSMANGGSMPVVDETDILVVTDGRPRHYAEDGSANLLFLADRIVIDFPEITLPKGKTGEWIGVAVHLVDYPIEGGTQRVSIGDLMRWIGAALFLVMIPFLLVRIPFRLARDGVRLERKKRSDDQKPGPD